MVTATAQTAILQAAASALARDPGASMQEIATEAGVGRATVHRYFPKREDLIREIALSCNAKIDEIIEPLRGQGLSASDVLWRVLEGVVPLGNQYRVLAEHVFIQDPEVQAGYQRHLEQLGNLVDQLKQEGVIGADVPRAWVVRTIEALIYTAWSQASDGFIAPRDAAGLVYRTIVNGLGATPERSNGL